MERLERGHQVIWEPVIGSSREVVGLRLTTWDCVVIFLSVTDLPGPPSAQANREKIDALKRCTQEIARDRRSRDDTRISYLETLEDHDNDNLRLAQMLAR
jgi:hypothetical protein